MMDKKRLLLIGLSVAAVLSLLYGVLTPSKTRQQVQGPSSEVALPVISAEGMPARRAVRSTYADWGRNPFSPEEISTSASLALLSLEGIAWDPVNPKAVINDRIVGLGDKIGGATVTDIRHDSVTVSDGKKEFELTLGRKPSS